MKLLLKQYLASLKERDELDIVLPDILSEVGYTVISRPKRGTAQYGVDVAAIGENPETGKKTLFLLSIKSGDLTRDEWASGKQALRPSLEDILEVYIPKHLPARYRELPITIVLCFGGDIQEDVRVRVHGFMDKHRVPGQIEFEEWNGDHIASLIATGLLRENIFPKDMQTSFRKAVALVDEPDVCLTHFSRLIHQLAASAPRNNAERLRVARQVYLAAWTIFVWCRDTGNLEAAYRCITLGTLHLWHGCHKHFGSSKSAMALAEVMQKMLGLNKLISFAFIEMHVAPFAGIQDGLGASVPSPSSVDVNLKLFEVLGRAGLHGLWLLHTKSILRQDADPEFGKELDNQISKTSDLICNLIRTNPAYFTPLRDDHAIDFSLAGLFLLHAARHDILLDWVQQITLSSIFSYRSNGAYPCALRDYASLASHPQPGDGYKESATIGSILYPTLGLWLGIFQDGQTFEKLNDFRIRHMQHSTWQLWVPDDITDEHLYTNSGIHGACIAHLDTANGPQTLLDQLVKEIEASTDFEELSAVAYNHWPIVLMACHVHRLPIPPHFWTMDLVPAETGRSAPDEGPDILPAS